MKILFQLGAFIASKVPHEAAEKVEAFCLRQRLSRSEQIDFLMNYSKLKQDGVKDRKAITALREEYSDSLGLEANEVKYCNEALASMQSGAIGIDEGMQRWFDPDLAQVAKTANASKNGSEALKILLEHIEKWQVVKNDVYAAFKKPLLWLAGSMLGTYLVATVGIKALAGDTPKEKWTETALAYDEFGVFLNTYSDVILMFVLLLTAIYFWVMFFYVGESRRYLDKYVPGFAFYQASQASRFFSIMAVLVSPNGGKLTLKPALEQFEGNDDLTSDYLAEHVAEMLELSERGRFALEQLDTGLLPKRMRVRLGVAGKTSGGLSMSDTFDSIANNLSSDFGHSMAKTVTRYFNVAKIISILLLMGAISAALDGVFGRLDAFL